jgi:hypothetical protein
MHDGLQKNMVFSAPSHPNSNTTTIKMLNTVFFDKSGPFLIKELWDKFRKRPYLSKIHRYPFITKDVTIFYGSLTKKYSLHSKI